VANFLFYLMAAGAVGSALTVVLARNPLTSVIALLASFVALATIYLLAGFQLLAAAQVLVYAGAILVLFLFVIMLLNLSNAGPLEEIDLALLRKRSSGWALAVVLALFVAGVAAVVSGRLPAPSGAALPPQGFDEPKAMAAAMFGRYLLPFEAISLLLLATAVAVLVLAKRDRRPGTQGSASSASQSSRIAEAASAARRESGVPALPASSAEPRRREETSGARP
jgi:NADH-quinone oxidoreductase subunit J